MNWEHIRLIFCREMRDQLRDRRTMFTIAILPILLYPIMGMVLLQITQFHRDQLVKVLVIGDEAWPSDKPLFDDHHIAPQWLSPSEANLVETHTLAPNDRPPFHHDDGLAAWAEPKIQRGDYDLVVHIRPDCAEKLSALSVALPLRDKSASGLSGTTEVPIEETLRSVLTVFGSKTNDRSVLAERRIRVALDAWQRSWFQDTIHQASLHPDVLQPIELKTIDLSPPANRSAMLWAKLLPFVMLVWALTGAFYPAIDLCAGEKERGTLETLLSSPAHRRDIVWGKLLTVMSFSVGTALLNLISMQVTASMMMQQFSRLGSFQVAQTLSPLPVSSVGWLIMMLLPIAALFSAVAMAIASLARSSKEGQYYLMPLLLIGMPLVMIPMLPGVELSIGMSIVPVTGAVLLARTLLEGKYHEAIIHLPFVVAVTASACWLAIRWAVGQFESESVLFRENEKFSLHNWLRHLWRDRGQTASLAEALLCGVVILVALFFGRLMASEPALQWSSIARSTLLIQFGLVLAPCLVMATMLTRSLRESLRIHLLHPLDLPIAALTAICLHPCYVFFAQLIQQEYAIGADTKAMLAQYDAVLYTAPFWSVIFCLAVFPAICEELTFRGFIFGGLLNQNRPLQAILISSVLFGLSHGMLQQSIAASLMGLVLGFIAWRSGGVLCGLLFHIIHNSLSLSFGRLGSLDQPIPTGLDWAVQATESGWAYTDSWFWLGFLLASLGLAWFSVRQVPKRFSRRRVERSSTTSLSAAKILESRSQTGL